MTNTRPVPQHCYRTGCTRPVTRYHDGDCFAKCEACYQRDRANPWGSVARLPEDVTRDDRPSLRRVK